MIVNKTRKKNKNKIKTRKKNTKRNVQFKINRKTKTKTKKNMKGGSGPKHPPPAPKPHAPNTPKSHPHLGFKGKTSIEAHKIVGSQDPQKTLKQSYTPPNIRTSLNISKFSAFIPKPTTNSFVKPGDSPGVKRLNTSKYSAFGPSVVKPVISDPAKSVAAKSDVVAKLLASHHTTNSGPPVVKPVASDPAKSAAVAAVLARHNPSSPNSGPSVVKSNVSGSANSVAVKSAAVDALLAKHNPETHPSSSSDSTYASLVKPASIQVSNPMYSTLDNSINPKSNKPDYSTLSRNLGSNTPTTNKKEEPIYATIRNNQITTNIKKPPLPLPLTVEKIAELQAKEAAEKAAKEAATKLSQSNIKKPQSTSNTKKSLIKKIRAVLERRRKSKKNSTPHKLEPNPLYESLTKVIPNKTNSNPYKDPNTLLTKPTENPYENLNKVSNSHYMDMSKPQSS